MHQLNNYIRQHNTNIDERYHQLTFYNTLSCASFASFFEQIKRVNGDIIECGIGRSRSLTILCSMVAGLGLPRRIIAYDSFAGFPPPSPQDISPRAPRQGEWSQSPSGKYLYTEDFCRTVLAEAEIPLESLDITLVKGYFSETLPQNNSTSIALLNIDGDLYQSYQDCLKYLFHKVSPGGIIIFDDFQDEQESQQLFPGARLAAKEFLGNQEYKKIQQNEFGVYYYIKTMLSG